MKNFENFRSSGSIYTPALSPAFVKPLSTENNQDLAGKFNWLNKDAPWHYKWSLYSAGHAHLDIDISDVKESFVQSRDRDDSLIIGDSGGFQIATGVMKFDWANEENITDMNLESNQQRMKLLRWLEHTSDLATTLDWPTWMFDASDNKFGRGKGTMLKSPKHCIEGTVRNLEFFKNNRQNEDMRFLNVLQGRDNEEAVTWYDAVKKYKFNGWAIAGPTRLKLGESMMRMIKMRDEHMFEDGADWIHFLGVSKLSAGLSLTALQLAMRKHINDKIQISYDSASPFLMAAFGSIYHGSHVSRHDLSMHASNVYKGKLLFDNKKHWPVDSPVNSNYPIDMFTDDEAKHKWLLRGYLKLMYDNTYQLCTALEQATDIYLNSPQSFKVQNIPSNVLELEQIFDDIFSSDEPDVLLENSRIRFVLNNAINDHKDEFKINQAANNAILNILDTNNFEMLREAASEMKPKKVKLKTNEDVLSTFFK